MTLEIGDRFSVASPQEVRNARGRLLARYLPEFGYAVTDRNVGFARQLEADGQASPAAPASASAGFALKSGTAKARGKVSTMKGSN